MSSTSSNTQEFTYDELMAEATRLLAKLQSCIAKLEEERRWIPVRERPPENGKDVLVVFQGNLAVGRHLTNQQYLDNNFEYAKGDIWELGIEDISYWKGEGYEEVTHWMYVMPLPEPSEVSE